MLDVDPPVVNMSARLRRKARLAASLNAHEPLGSGLAILVFVKGCYRELRRKLGRSQFSDRIASCLRNEKTPVDPSNTNSPRSPVLRICTLRVCPSRTISVWRSRLFNKARVLSKPKPMANNSPKQPTITMAVGVRIATKDNDVTKARQNTEPNIIRKVACLSTTASTRNVPAVRYIARIDRRIMSCLRRARPGRRLLHNDMTLRVMVALADSK